MASAPEKPAHGAPCNGCGFCCRRSLCPLAEIILGPRPAPCPALEPSGDGFGCGLMLNPETYAPIRTSIHGKEAMGEAAKLLIGSGVGCDCYSDDEVPNHKEIWEKGRAYYRSVEAEIPRAKRLWCVSGN